MPVFIRHGDREVGWFTSRDIGNGGIALKGQAGLGRNCIVSISFEVRRHDRIVTETARAIVVYEGRGRTGLMWVSNAVALRRLLSESAEAAAA